MAVHPVLAAAGQFLHLSRTQAELFNQPQSFSISDGTQVTIHAAGIIEFAPVNAATQAILLSCGIHGNETAPIEILDAMVQDILCGRLVVKHRLMVQFGNLPAMDIAERFVDENMNRLFSGAHSKAPGLVNQERIRAKQLEDCTRAFFLKDSLPRCHYDLHTAIRASKNDKFAVYPFLHGKPWKAQQISFMQACGVNTILLSNSPTTTYSYFSSHQFGADAFTVELGKVRPFGQNNMADFAEVTSTLRALVAGEALNLPDYQDDAVNLFSVNQVINKTQPDFRLHFADDAPNFSDFKQGELLASETGHEYRALVDGEAIVFPNANVALGQRALLTVAPVTLQQANEGKADV